MSCFSVISLFYLVVMPDDQEFSVLDTMFDLLQTVFDPMFISVYNLFYTSLPVLALGIFDQDVSDRNSLCYPKLYTPGHSNLLFNKREFLRSALHGFFTSCVLFLIPYGTYISVHSKPLSYDLEG